MTSLKYFLYINIFVLSILCGCSINAYDKQKALNIQEETILEKAKLSAVKISIANILTLKEKSKTTIEDIAVNEANGSGSIVGQTEYGTFILTAGHVCHFVNNEKIKEHFPFYNSSKYDVSITHKYIITDAYSKNHPAILLVIHRKNDTCILLSSKIETTAVNIETRELRPSERVFSVSFPRGIWDKGFFPTFEGVFIGPVQVEEHTNFGFSLRSAPGSSGGPIFDFDGNQVAMIHSYVMEFDQITIAATSPQIKEILDVAKDFYEIDKVRLNGFLRDEEKIFNNVTENKE